MMFICHSRRRRPPPAHALAGVNDILAKCHDFGRHMFALYEAGAVAGRMLAFIAQCATSDLTLQSQVSS